MHRLSTFMCIAAALSLPGSMPRLLAMLAGYTQPVRQHCLPVHALMVSSEIIQSLELACRR